MSVNQSSFIFINSKDRIPNSVSNTDFIVFLNDFNNLRGGVEVSLESCELYAVQYPIRANHNNQFRFNEAVAPGTYYTVTVADGVYTGTQIATELATLMTAAGTYNYSGTFNTITQKISITTVIPDTWSFDSSTLTYPINKYIGFPTTNNTLAVGHTGVYPVNLNTDLYVNLQLDGWSNNNIETSGLNDIFHRIPLLGSYGEYIHFQTSDDNDHTIISDEQLNTVRVRLLNPDSTTYTIPDNFEVSLTLRLTKIN